MPKSLSRGNITAKSHDNEKLLAINELQKAANSVYRAGPFKVSTADAGPDVVWTSDAIPEGALWSIVATAQGQSSTDQAFFVRYGLFFRPVGGVVTQTSVTANTTIRSAAQTATYAVVGNTVTLSVAGLAGNYSWSTWIEIRVSI